MKKKLLILLKIALSVSIIASLGYYVIDLTLLHSSPFEHILIPALFAILPVLLIVAISQIKRRRILKATKSKFKEEIAGTFEKRRNLNKLLYAIYFFTIGKNKKSIRKLNKLKSKCKSKKDYVVIALFSALNYTAQDNIEQAVSIYEQSIKEGHGSTVIFNNLGHLYSKLGNDKKAHENYDIAIRKDKENITAYHNKAQLCFKEGNYKESIKLSKKALELNPKFAPSTTLLAIIYAIYGTYEEAIAAKGKAIENGEAPVSIDRAVNYYRKNLT
jgi:tetratricopeptide (TPR) repeat protein